MEMFQCMCMLQILPRTLIQTVLQNMEYSVTLDCCMYVLSLLDMYIKLLATYNTLTCTRIFLSFTNLLLQFAVAN